MRDRRGGPVMAREGEPGTHKRRQEDDKPWMRGKQNTLEEKNWRLCDSSNVTYDP